jgi:hypothetical protein
LLWIAARERYIAGIETNWRSQGAMTKIGGIKRDGLFTREVTGDKPYFIFDITKARYEGSGRALVM